MLPRLDRQPGDRPRRSRLATSFAFFINGFVIATWVPNIPYVKDRLALDPTVLGIALASMAVGALISMPVAGWLAARRGSARMTLSFGLILCAVLPLPFLAPTPVVLVAMLFTLGAMNGAMDVSMNAQGSHVEWLRGKPIMSSFHGAWSLAGLAGAVLASLVHVAGIDPLVHVTAVAAVLAVALVIVSFELERDDRAAEPPVLLALPRRELLGLGFVCFCSMLAEGSVGDWSAVYLRDDLGAPGAVLPLGFAAFSLAMAVGRFGGDRLVRAFGAPRTIVAGGSMVVLGMGGALILALPAAALAGFMLVGLGLANAVPLMFSAAGRVPGVPAGTGIAAASTFGYSGFLVGPSVIGLVAGAAGLAAALWLPVLCGVVIVAVGPRALRSTARG